MALSDKLQIFLITYNRADKLEKTLLRLAESPFAPCFASILDNASTDRTPEVCEQFKTSFTNLKLLRREKNIGGCANFMEAFSAPCKGYKWILCDDDYFDLTVAEELIGLIEEGSFDVILAGSPGLKKKDYGYAGSAPVLIAGGSRFYFTATFLPGLIFKSSLLDDDSIMRGYDILHYLWPHLPFVHKLVRENRSVKILSRPLMQRGFSDPPENMGRSVFYSWCRSCCAIDDTAWREKAILQFFDGQFFLRSLFALTEDLQRGALKRSQLFYLIENLPRGLLGLRISLISLLFFPVWLLGINLKFSSAMSNLRLGRARFVGKSEKTTIWKQPKKISGGCGL